VTRQQRASAPPKPADEEWQFTREGRTATLRLGTFTTWKMKRDWRAFLRESFASARGAEKLVIGLATLIGRETGGNRRGTNGGRVAFLKLPASGIEVDVPLVGYFPATPQSDRGIVPDVSR
jgi:hypothetical protein